MASQLLSVLSPLRATPAGAHTLTVLLHPETLGDVRATITSAGNQVLVRLVASTNEGATALRGALPDLHHGLAEGGQRPVVVLADGTGGGSPFPQSGHGPSGQPSTGHAFTSSGPGTAVATASPTPTPISPAPGANRLLDVRL